LIYNNLTDEYILISDCINNNMWNIIYGIPQLYNPNDTNISSTVFSSEFPYPSSIPITSIMSNTIISTNPDSMDNSNQNNLSPTSSLVYTSINTILSTNFNSYLISSLIQTSIVLINNSKYKIKIIMN